MLRSLVGRDLMASLRWMRSCTAVVTSCCHPDAGMTPFVSLLYRVVPNAVGWSRLDGIAGQAEAAGGKSGIQSAAGKEGTDAPNEGSKGHCGERGKQAR